MAYAKFRADNMAGTTLGKDLVALKYRVSTADTDIQNGNFVAIGDMITTEPDVYVAATPAVDTAIGKIAVVGSPEVVKNVSYNGLGDFINKAGTVARGYILETHDKFSVTADALDHAATIAVGDIVELQAGTKGKVVSTLTSGSTKIGTIIAIEGEWYVIEVA